MKSHRGEAVIRDVLEAVRDEIARVGFRAMRIEDVAARAAVAKTTIYRRWPKKEDLLYDLLQTMMSAKRDALVETGTLRGDLIAIGRYVLGVMQSVNGQAISRMMMIERADPEVRSVIDRIRESNVSIPRLMLEKARARGELADFVVPELLLETLVGTLHHAVFVHCLEMEGDPVEAIVDLLLNGARPR